MATLILDTLRMKRKLTTHDFSDVQAVGIVETIQEIDMDEVATIAHVDMRIAQLDKKISETKYELSKWMFAGFITMFALQIGIIVKLFG